MAKLEWWEFNRPRVMVALWPYTVIFFILFFATAFAFAKIEQATNEPLSNVTIAAVCLPFVLFFLYFGYVTQSLFAGKERWGTKDAHKRIARVKQDDKSR